MEDHLAQTVQYISILGGSLCLFAKIESYFLNILCQWKDCDSDCVVISEISLPGSSMWQTDREMRLSGSANGGRVQD